MNMTQANLADGICSVSHLSKIENDFYDINKDTLQSLLNRLGIDYQEEREKMLNARKSIHAFIDSIHFGDDHQMLQQYEELILEEDYYLSSELNKVYLLAKYKYHTYRNNLSESERTKKLIDKLGVHFDHYEDLLYMTCTSSVLIKQNRPREALEVLQNNESLKEGSRLIGEFYYQIALCYSLLQLPDKAIMYCRKANVLFQEECNFIKILYTQMTLAINYVRVELLGEARLIYQRILRNASLLGMQELYEQNLYNYALLLKKDNNLSLALEHFWKCEESFRKGTDHHLLTLINIIEISMEMGMAKDCIMPFIKQLQQGSESIKSKKFGLVALKYKYQLLYPLQKYMNFLERKYLPHVQKKGDRESIKETVLELAQYYQEIDTVKSNEYFQLYFD
jgi:HTH-type transcriptional regulator, quorum sensing regulator NprR